MKLRKPYMHEAPECNVPKGFVAIKPKKGQWLVSLDREKVYGRVTEVRDNGTIKYETTGSIVVEVDTARSHRTWESIQYDWGRCRFVDEVPEGFTRKGNDWRPPR